MSIKRFVIECVSRTGKVGYFYGPSLKKKYCAKMFVTCPEAAKFYESMGHAVATGNKLGYETHGVASVRVIEVDVSAKPTGGVVKKKRRLEKTGDNSAYVVELKLPSVAHLRSYSI